jgi:hypothetical protein
MPSSTSGSFAADRDRAFGVTRRRFLLRGAANRVASSQFHLVIG